MSESVDWQRLLQFLEPKAPLYCPDYATVTPEQKAFLRFEGVEALFGGSAGGGKSSALLMAALQYVDVPGYDAMLFRRTLSDMVTPGALMDRFKDWIAPYDEIKWNGNEFKATFPSGATVSFGYLNNPLDHLRYKGTELMFVGMDEVSEIREEHYKYLFSRMRRPPTGPLAQIPMRMRCTSNPAPNWVRQHFIVEGKSKGRIFVPAKMDNNPGVDAASYRMMLSNLDPVERKRLEEGDWWATALGTMFRRGDFEIIDQSQIPDFESSVRLVRFWDLAATEKTETNNPDWTVGTLAMFTGGKFYVLDVQRARVRSDKVEELIARTAKEDGILVPIRMEQEPGSAGKNLADQYARYILPGFDFRAIPASGDKVLRAQPFASAVANKNVFVVRSKWWTDWIDELSSFPEACDHDDQVDSVVGAFNFLTGLGLPQRRPARIIV